MQQSVIDSLRRVYAAPDVPTGLGALADIVHEDVEMLTSGRFLDVSPEIELKGRDKITTFFGEVAKAFEHVRYDLQLIEVHGDVILAKVVFLAEGQTSGIAVEDPVYHVHRVRDGRIARIEVYLSKSEAEAAI